MKAITKIIAAFVAAVSVLSVAGCSGAPRSAKTATSANWNVRTSASVEKNFTEHWLSHKEVAEYKIGFSKGANSTYSINYDTESGVYRTEFGMTRVDLSSAENMPEGYAPEQAGEQLVYYFKTEWNLSGEYVLTRNGDKYAFEDKTTSLCYYRLAGDNLQPVYSVQHIKSTPPNTLNASSIGSAYVKVDGVYETFYNDDCTKATIYHTNNLTNTADNIGIGVSEVSVSDKVGHSVFDNSQLRAAVRAFNLSGGATHTFNVLAPQNGGIQLCTATCTSPVKLDKENEEQEGIIAALEECSRNNPDYIFFDATPGEDEEERNYRFNAVSMGISTDDPMTGATPTLWYSTVENNDVNYSKCVLLRMSTPIPFGLGTLTYSLKSLNLVSSAN